LKRARWVDVDFFSTPGHPTGTFTPPSIQMAEDKAEFGTSRHARWFGIDARWRQRSCSGWPP
jgi:hypothetical protein